MHYFAPKRGIQMTGQPYVKELSTMPGAAIAFAATVVRKIPVCRQIRLTH